MRGARFVVSAWMAIGVLTVPHTAWGSCPAPEPIAAAGPTRSGVPTRVAFRVIEVFKGTKPERLTLALRPSSEEFAYEKGQRILVYANRDRGLWTTACTRTKMFSPTDPELKEVAALRDTRGGWLAVRGR